MTTVLRDYQQECIAEFRARVAAGDVRIPSVLATGLGKTEIFTSPAFLDPYFDVGQRVLIIAHTDELIEQAAKKARRNNPGRRVGIVKGQEHNQPHAQIVISSRQTLARTTRREQIRNVGLIIVDEAHHATRTNTYGQILEHFGAFGCSCPQDPDDEIDPGDPLSTCINHGWNSPGVVHVAGFTATLARGDKTKLAPVWGTKRPFTRDILFGIRHGFLLDVVGKRVIVPDMDMSNVRVSAGDYRDSDIAEELERTFAPEVVAKSYLEHATASGRLRKGIAFWPLVETAEHGARAFNEAGIRSEVIHGKLDKTTRRGLLRRLHTGETTVVHGVGVLTEGFDEPTVDVVVIARPTRSAPLYQQMVGRVLRPNLELSPAERGKALVLDVVGGAGTHDLRSLVDLAPERPLKRDADEEQSLLDMEIEWELAQEEQERADGGGFLLEGAEDYAGDTEVVEFDPLGRSQLWARTPGGTWYMGAGGGAYCFLAESLAGDPGTYDVVLCSKARPVNADLWMGNSWVQPTEHTEMPLDMALGWGEDVALRHGGYGAKTLTGRKAAWRRGKPSEKSLNHARRLGLVVPPEHDAGQVSAAIDAEYARRRIDPLVAGVRAMVS